LHGAPRIVIFPRRRDQPHPPEKRQTWKRVLLKAAFKQLSAICMRKARDQKQSAKSLISGQQFG